VNIILLATLASSITPNMHAQHFFQLGSHLFKYEVIESSIEVPHSLHPARPQQLIVVFQIKQQPSPDASSCA